ncbi:hypothetical protein COO60DRAFT_1493007 [Scenedesmus sp. NREL 46B-D3]|nr:hypothetical protein COO60DRAFT_1493007 [Scenedesmus sp. NREL 46B-D3]
MFISAWCRLPVSLKLLVPDCLCCCCCHHQVKTGRGTYQKKGETGRTTSEEDFNIDAGKWAKNWRPITAWIEHFGSHPVWGFNDHSVSGCSLSLQRRLGRLGTANNRIMLGCCMTASSARANAVSAVMSCSSTSVVAAII